MITMNKKLLLSVVLLAACIIARAQTTFLPLGSDDYHLLDRLETMSGRLSDTLCQTDKPESRKRTIAFLQQSDTANKALSAVDRYDMQQMISENGEWTADGNGAIDSKHPVFNTFYKKQYDFFYVKTNDFFLVIDPVMSLQGLKETGGSSLLQTNSRGFEARGWISKKIGFYTSCTGNNEMTPAFITSYINSRKAVPGNDYYIYRNSDYNYLQASGYFDFAVVKNHLNMTFGYGKNFIGDGITSVFLSDFSSSYPYLKFTTHIWKFNYQNLFVRLTPQFANRNGELPHRFTTFHQLSLNVTKWLNIGFFEAVVSGHYDTYDIGYMNPIIYYRALEQSNGSPDNELIGYSMKAIVLKRLQLYGQFLFDEFKPKDFFSNDGFWANKWAMQMGAKYFNAFTIKNLDLQAEMNIVRPYTYSHYDTIANYTNYNQPLANPLGSGFEQLIGIARYEPVRNLTVSVTGMYYIKGADTGKINYGNNMFLNYNTRKSDYGVGNINGVKTNCTSLELNASYQLRRNLFIDLGATQRNFKSDYKGIISSSTGTSVGNISTTYYYLGIRLNAARRSYNFF